MTQTVCPIPKPGVGEVRRRSVLSEAAGYSGPWNDRATIDVDLALAGPCSLWAHMHTAARAITAVIEKEEDPAIVEVWATRSPYPDDPGTLYTRLL